MSRVIDGRIIHNVSSEYEGIICPYCDRLTKARRAVDGGVVRYCDKDKAIWWFHPDGRLDRLS